MAAWPCLFYRISSKPNIYKYKAQTTTYKLNIQEATRHTSEILGFHFRDRHLENITYTQVYIFSTYLIM